MTDSVKQAFDDFYGYRDSESLSSTDWTIKQIRLSTWLDAWGEAQTEIKRLREALEALAELAGDFNVSGVYFDEFKSHKAVLDQAWKALEKP